MEGGSGAGSAAQPADLDWEASEVTAPERRPRSPRRSGSRPWVPRVGAATSRAGPRAMVTALPPARQALLLPERSAQVSAGSVGSEPGEARPVTTV